MMVAVVVDQKKMFFFFEMKEILFVTINKE